MDFKKYIPENKYDIATVELARSIGFPKLNPILSNLLVWVQDANWPVAAGTASLLSNAGPEIVPHIKDVLNSEDGMWKYWTIELVAKNLTPEVRSELRTDLVRIATAPTLDDIYCDVDKAANDVLSH